MRMNINSGYVICEAPLSLPLELLDRAQFPRSYGPSMKHKKTYAYICLVELAFALVAPENLGFYGFLVLINIATVLYCFGSKVTLRVKEIEYQSSFLFKRRIQRKDILRWQLQVNEFKGGAQIFSMVLKSETRDLVIEINFKLDDAFYEWFPDLRTLVEQNWFQWPRLQELDRA
jgi:hypothetical protein